MKINFRATRAKFDKTCMSQRRFARANGIDDAIFTQVLNGRYTSMNSPSALAVLDLLRSIDVLVEEPEESVNQAA